jgi:hypothetical protein
MFNYKCHTDAGVRVVASEEEVGLEQKHVERCSVFEVTLINKITVSCLVDHQGSAWEWSVKETLRSDMASGEETSH